MLNYVPLFWGVLAGILLIIELMGPALISIWLSLSAFLTMFLSFFVKDISIQLLFFAIMSLVFIFSTRKFLKVVLKKENDDFTAQMKNEKVIVVKANNLKYEVKYKGILWDAISTETFLVDDEAVIQGFKGNKIIIGKEEAK